MTDEETGVQLTGYLEIESQTFVPDERTYMRDGERFIYAQNQEAGQREAVRQTERGRKRAESYTWSEPSSSVA